MRCLLAVILLSTLFSRAQDSTATCESYKVDDDSVTVCTSGEYKSVMRCAGDGSKCTTITRKLDEDYSDESLRTFCTAGLNDSCSKLASNLDVRKHTDKTMGGSICDQDYFRPNNPEKCKKEADELKLNAEVVSKWLEREEAKDTAKRLELCDKKVYEKDYCDALKKKQQAKPEAHPSTDAH